MRGRKPVPTSLKLLRGNPGKRPLHPEPRPVPSSTVPPVWLTDRTARVEYERLAPELVRMGLLTVVDVPVLAAWCECFAQWREAQECLEEADASNDGLYLSLAGVVAKRRAELVKLAAEFGFTPSSRSRVHATPPPPLGKLDQFRNR